MVIQIFGILFGFVMVYITYFYYRRKEFNFIDFMIWITIWSAFLFFISFPEMLSWLLNPLKIARLLDLLMIMSFVVLFALISFLYNETKKNERRIKEIVREISLKNVRENEKGCKKD